MEAGAAGADARSDALSGEGVVEGEGEGEGEGVVAEVVALFGPLATLKSRSATLDGSIPLRAAQGCAPLLEGNSFGRQVHFGGEHPAVLVERSLVSPRVTVDEAFARAHRAVLPVLAAQGVLGAPQHAGFFARYAKSPAVFERGVLRVFTGLLVRPARGVALRVGSTANRRPFGFTVDTAWVTDANALAPLELTVRPQWDECVPRGRFALRGEVATVGAFRAGARMTVRPLEEDLGAARAHTSFYSPEYFQNKRDGVTRAYRKALDPSPPSAGAEEGPTHVVEAGPGRIELVRGEGPVPDTVRFDALLGFEAAYDGHTVALTYDEAALASHARALEARWGRSFGAEFLREHKRALWYLTKYFTPHTPGEPHFFVKPWAFVRSPPGWSALLEGVHGAGYDVLRGVVHTDAFHAAPAVFALRGGAPARVTERTALLEVTPIPRVNLRAKWALRDFATR